MIKQTLLKRELFVRGPKVFGLAIFCVVSILVAVLTLLQPASKVAAATNNNLNFQARLQTNTGALVPDGYYNIEFKLYTELDPDAGETPQQGGCTVSGPAADEDCVWTETWYDSNGATAGNDNRVRVKNGYLTVNLGKHTTFPSTINWNQDLYISMRVGGSAQTTTPTWDTEMSPRLKLTGVPYAFRAGQLAAYNSTTGFTGVLQFQATTGGNQTFVIPDQGASGTYTLLTTSSASGSYIQNTTTLQTNSNFHISGDGKAATSLQTPLLDTISAGTLSVGTGTATALSLSKSGATTTVNGALTVAEATNLNGNLTIGNATTDRLTVTSQILGGSPLVLQGATDDSFTTTLSLVDPTGNNVITLPNASGTVQLAPTSGSYIQQVPSTTADNTITPTASGVVGLTVNATSNATGAIAAVINQGRAFTALDINTTNAAGTQTNAVQIARNGAGGTTTNLLNLTNTTGTATHGLTFTGTFATNLINAPNFTVSNGGAITGVGVNSGAGLIQGTGGITVTGTALINATGTANTQIGNATGTFQLDSDTIDISSGGAISGVTGYSQASGNFSQTGTGTFSTGTGAISLNGDTTIANDKRLSIGSTSGLASAFNVTAPGGAELNVKTSGGLRVSVGDTANCTNGRFCVEQAINGATAGTFHNSYNTQTITSSGGSNVVTAVGQQIVIQDTGSTAGNEIRGLFVDTTGTSNTGTGIQGLWVRNPSSNSGNLLRLQTGTTDRFLVNNNGALAHTYGATSNSTAHTLTLNNTTGTQTNALLIDRNGSGGTTTNLINLTNTAGTVSNAINISSGTFTTGINFNGGTFTNLIDSASLDISNGGAITGVTGLTFAAGSGNFDQSASAGTFATGTGAVTLNGDTTVAAGKSLIINGNTQFKQGTDFSTNGSSNDVNFGVTSFVRLTGSATQTITGITGGADGRTLTILNAGSVAAVISNNSGSSTAANRITTGTGGDISLPVGASITVIYDNTASLWRLVGGTSASGGAGVNTIGTFNSGTSYANGASISGTTLTLGAADGTNPGLVSTVSQTFAGTKTFSGNIIGQSGLSISGALVELNHNSNFAVNIGTGTNNGLVSIGGGSGTFALNTSNIDISAAGAISGITGYDQDTGNFDASGSTGTFATSTGNVSLNGDTSVASGKTFTANGTALFKNNVDSTAAFQIQNAVGTSIVNVETAADSANLITNPSFEVNTTGWSARTGTANFQRITTQYFSGAAALSYDSDAIGEGVNYPIQLSPNTAYVIQAYIKANGTNTGLRMGYAHDGSDETTYLSGALSYNSGGWIRARYEFTTPATVAANAYVFFTSTLNTARTFYIDTASITAIGSGFYPLYSEGKIQLNGVLTNPILMRNTSDSNTAFEIQNSSAGRLLSADTLNGIVTIGNIVQSASTPSKLYVNSTSTIGLTLAQSSTSDGAVISLTSSSGTQTNGLLVNRTGNGTTTNLLNLSNSAASGTVTNLLNLSNAGTSTNAINISSGTFTTGINFNGSTFTNLIDSANFDVSNAGAVTAVGVNSGSGLLQGSGGLTITGATSINNNNNSATDINTGSSTGLVSIGGGAGTFALNTTNIDISSAGVISGVTGLTLVGTADFATQRNTTDFTTTGTSNDVNLGTGSLFRLNGASAQTITGLAGGVDGRRLTIVNAAAQAATISNNSGSSTAANRITTGTGADLSLPAGGSIELVYDSSASLWRMVGGSSAAGGAGVNTIGTFNSGTSYANGGQISGTTLTFGAADATNPGMVSTAAQTFAGDKTFNGQIIGAAGISVTGGAVSLTGNAASSLTTSSGALTLTSAAAATWSTTAGNLTLQAGSGTVSLGTSTALTANGALGITSGGSGNLTLDTSGAATLNLGNTNATTINLGTNNNNPTINIGTGTGNDTINIGTGSGTNSISIGNSSGTNTISAVGATTLTSGAAGQIATTIQGVSGQTASLLQVKTQSSGGTLAVNIQADGSAAFLGAQPAAVSSGNGTTAGSFGYSFTATGAKGGNTSAAGQSGGNGGSLSLTGGAGGDPTGGGTNGSGGSIILQGGAPGSGGTGGFYGNVSIQASGGFTGIGTAAGLNTLLVKGVTTADLLATSIFGTGSTGFKGIVVQGVAGQTANLFELQDSAGSILMSANAGAHLETLGGYNNPWGGVGAYGNLLTQSEAFDNAIWTRTNVTAPTADTVTDPVGSTTAESLATSGGGGSIGQTSGTATSNNNFTFSVWLKTASGTQSAALRVDGATSGAGTAKFVTVTSTWQRFFVTQNTNGFTGNVRAIIFPGGIGSGTVHAWGASLQLSSTPGVYVQTTSAIVAAANGLAGRNIYTPGTITSGGAINGLTLAAAADGFTIAGGTTPRTLTVTGANITVGSTIQPTSAGTLAIQSNGANNMTVDTGGAATLNLGSANATNITIGNSSATINFNVPTAQFTESASARTLTVATRSSANVGTGLNVRAGTGNGANAGGVLTLQGGTGGATGGGGNTLVYGGDAGGGNTNGGNVTISGGAKAGSGTGGSVIIKPQSGNDSTTAFQVQNASGTALMNVNTTSNAISLLSTIVPDITSWTDQTSTPLTAARSSHALTYGNGYVYVIGGGGSTTSYYSKVNSDGTLAGWATTTTISGATTGTDEANAVFLNGYVYYIGGSNGGTAVTTIIYAKQNADGTLGSWMTATGLPNARLASAVMTAYGNIYVLGGTDGTPSTSVYHAKPGADGAISSWTTSGNTLPFARHYASGTSVNGVLYVVGGADTSFNATNTVFHATVNPVTGAVGSWTNSGSTLPAARTASTVYAANGYLYSTGGENSGSHNETYYSRIGSSGTLGAWSTLGSTANLPTNNAYARGFVANGYVYSVGGYNGTVELTNVYSASFPRVQMGGNLDLLGLQGANMNDGSDATSGSMGGSITAGNIRAAGVLEVAGAALINGGAVIAGNSVLDAVSANSLVFNESGSARTIGVQTRTSTGVGTGLTVSAGGGNGSSAGGVLTLQGGNSGASGNVNGGNVNITGGTGNGTGARGLVVIDTPTVNTTTSDANCGATTTANCTIAASTVNNTSSVIVGVSTNTGVTISMPDPTITTAGRIFYFTAANASLDFTLSLNGGGTGNTIAMRQNTTATLIWNGSDWTAAGASSSTTLQSAYDSTLSSAGGAEIVLNNTASSNGLTIRNNATSPISGGLLEIQTSIGSNLFSVNNNATEYANNGGAESSTFTMWTATPAGGTVSQSTTAGTMATGTASVSVVTTNTSHGAENTLTTTLTNNLQYTVSFTAKAASSSFSTLDVLYSQDGSSTTSCATGKTVTTAIWTRVSCTFTAPSSGITASNSIFIRQSDSTGRTFYIDNLSVTANASTNHAADGSVDSALGTNWTAYDADGGAGTTTPTRDTTTIYDTSGSVQDVTTANANLGVRNNMAIVPTVSTQYLVSFYARSSNTFNDIRVGFLPAGGNSTPAAAQLCSDYNTQSVSTTGWTKITCIITTPSSGISDPDLVIYQPTATARTFHVDALTISLNTNTASNVQVGGGSNGGPATLFTLDRSATAPIAANNDAYLGSMYYDTVTGRIQCYEADGWGACGAAPDTSVVLTPEYTGAVLNGTGIGTLTADFCSNQAGVLSVNTSFCASGLSRNYYKWTSPQASLQTYSIYVSYKLPSTFKTFNDDSTINLTALTDSTSNGSVTYEVFRSSGSAVSRCYDGGTNETAVTSVANTWQTVGINGNEATSCSFTAGDNVIFKINVKAQSNANVYVENLTFTYTNK